MEERKIYCHRQLLFYGSLLRGGMTASDTPVCSALSPVRPFTLITACSGEHLYKKASVISLVGDSKVPRIP